RRILRQTGNFLSRLVFDRIGLQRLWFSRHMLPAKGLTITESFPNHCRMRCHHSTFRKSDSIKTEAVHLAGVRDHLYRFLQGAQFRYQDLSVVLVDRDVLAILGALDDQNRTLNSGKPVTQDFPVLFGIESPRIFHYGTAIRRMVTLSPFRCMAVE